MKLNDFLYYFVDLLVLVKGFCSQKIKYLVNMVVSVVDLIFCEDVFFDLINQILSCYRISDCYDFVLEVI